MDIYDKERIVCMPIIHNLSWYSYSNPFILICKLNPKTWHYRVVYVCTWLYIQGFLTPVVWYDSNILWKLFALVMRNVESVPQLLAQLQNPTLTLDNILDRLKSSTPLAVVCGVWTSRSHVALWVRLRVGQNYKSMRGQIGHLSDQINWRIMQVWLIHNVPLKWIMIRSILWFECLDCRMVSWTELTQPLLTARTIAIIYTENPLLPMMGACSAHIISPEVWTCRDKQENNCRWGQGERHRPLIIFPRR